ncbi:hypothetical protein ABID22_001581 [Pontibacter aydingkolensis]|uniref:GAF domain-containing protein n=1 Tax=Pontibacter aydingkolensis TaxID=1911536 RepID=A0ABS7CTT0_9BACT|nr:hypothetical protein [Pontibacter aydingkolensis]MBW7467252.1 hypothetical protein [Pontibacter aydingkolensis]
MEYRHIHYLHFEPGVEENSVLDSAILLVNQPKKDNILLKIASFICRHTNVEYIGIGLLNKEKNEINTCVMLKRDKVLKNTNYSLKGTPCDKVLIQRFCYYPFDVQDYFPDDKILRKLNIKSYLGTILLSEDNEAIGVVELMDTKSIKNPAFAEHLILVLSPAIENELTLMLSEGKSC